ncbi:hypothetical protein COO60DRAFT_163875 [Scenedesmus sp. NREL 46B-D3]|nr:hypothetical protein COO60DRAFT_163875 [Scenedesmus sp. NREL 46B-D3]
MPGSRNHHRYARAASHWLASVLWFPGWNCLTNETELLVPHNTSGKYHTVPLTSCNHKLGHCGSPGGKTNTATSKGGGPRSAHASMIWHSRGLLLSHLSRFHFTRDTFSLFCFFMTLLSLGPLTLKTPTPGPACVLLSAAAAGGLPL